MRKSKSRMRKTAKTENEIKLEREVLRLEAKIELLERKLQIAENFNFKYYNEVQDLSYYIQQMEKH